MVEENFNNLQSLLQQIQGCEKVNDDEMQEWMEEDKQ
jgi:Tfp pilus assembly protein PilP